MIARRLGGFSAIVVPVLRADVEVYSRGVPRAGTRPQARKRGGTGAKTHRAHIIRGTTAWEGENCELRPSSKRVPARGCPASGRREREDRVV